MDQILIFSTILLALFLTAEFCDHILKIMDQKFYSIFHLLGGSFTFLLLNSILKSYLYAAGLTFVIGVIWEIHEWILWKYFLKKKKYKPEARDTKNDLIVDMTGATIALLVLEFFKISV